jgi:murein DD-endopeptidase MepM/ murein hydrolase activator NlpD
MVEINHGNGFVTRYAHNERNLVSVGETVQKGQPIALMGSTGRATGPNLHFEVLRNGRQVNPLQFVGGR